MSGRCTGMQRDCHSDASSSWFSCWVKTGMRVNSSWAAGSLCVIASLALAGCGSTRNTYLADGSRGYAISCKGMLNSWDSCLVKAGRICGARGYDTIDDDKYDRTLLIGCKSSQVANK